MITTCQIVNPQGYLYIVTDAHLDAETEKNKDFQRMLERLENPQMLICLGDLFKAWLAHPRFWTSLQKEVMRTFESLSAKQTEIVFVAGNRELLLPRNYTPRWRKRYPFHRLIHHDFHLEWGSQCYGFIHGDAINQRDKNYLRWKAIAHSLPFEWTFRAMPAVLAQWVALKVEEALGRTNQAFKIEFPEEEVRNFAQSVLNGKEVYFVGHFHVDHTMRLPDCSGYLRVVPDWLAQRAVLRIDPEGGIETLYY